MGKVNAYLFVWNSQFWPFSKLEPKIKEVQSTGKTEDIWGIASHKKAKLGDRVFITRVNAPIKGIFASGTIISKPYPFMNYKGKETPGVDIEFDTFLDPEKGQILDINYIKENTSEKQHWSPQSSGIQINPQIVDELEMLWADYLENQNILINSNIQQQTIIEGTSYQLVQTVYERNRYARILCLGHYGYSCKVCNFSFKDRYGDIGNEFIHVHHINPVAKSGIVITDPIKDLRPVCPNCHAMLHKKNPPYSIEELKSKLN